MCAWMLSSLRGAPATKQSMLSLLQDGLLRCARNDGAPGHVQPPVRAVPRRHGWTGWSIDKPGMTARHKGRIIADGRRQPNADPHHLLVFDAFSVPSVAPPPLTPPLRHGDYPGHEHRCPPIPSLVAHLLTGGRCDFFQISSSEAAIPGRPPFVCPVWRSLAQSRKRNT